MELVVTILGWLGRASWQTSVVVGVVLVVQGLTAAKLPARWRYALWWLAISFFIMLAVALVGLTDGKSDRSGSRPQGSTIHKEQ